MPLSPDAQWSGRAAARASGYAGPACHPQFAPSIIPACRSAQLKMIFLRQTKI
jgi:hypothetical protein